MTDTPDSGQTLNGDQVSQPAPSSSGAGVQPDSSVDIENLVTLLVENPAFLAALDRSTQSQKDRRFKKLEKKTDDFAERLARYEELSKKLPRDVALQFMDWQDRFGDMEGNEVDEGTPPGKGQASPGFDYVQVLSLMGLDANDADVTKIIRDGGDVGAQIAAFANLAQSRKQAQTQKAEQPPNPATVITSAGGTPAQNKDLQAQYYAELAKVRQGDSDAITRLKQKYRAQGLNIY